ncbi:MAG: sigma-70 family RNA polymerase sigma factor [Acidobacteriota bacterium]
MSEPRSTSEPRDEFELIREAKRGSNVALDRLFRRYGSRLLGLIRLRMGPSLRRRLESQDVLQSTMIKAFERLEQFEGAGETSLMGWLGAIARNEIRDQAKFHGRGARDAGCDVPLEVMVGAAAEPLRSEVSRIHLHDQARRLEAAIEALEEPHREMILLRRFEELSFPQIGRLLGKSPDACRMLYGRAMAALTVRLSDGGELGAR